MAYRLKPGTADQPQRKRDRRRSDRSRICPKFSGKDGRATAVHEARKSMKRLRALLHLVKPAMPKRAFAAQRSPHQDDRALACGRSRRPGDARDGRASWRRRTARRRSQPWRRLLRAHLQAECAEARARAGRVGRHPASQAAQGGESRIRGSCPSNRMTSPSSRRRWKPITARRAAPLARAYKLGEDEAFHDWRKYVQRHWRQLLLVAPSWPKALRPHIALARILSENLGDDHDLSVLAGHRAGGSRQAGQSGRGGGLYLAVPHAPGRAARHRASLGTRLLAEKPGSLAQPHQRLLGDRRIAFDNEDASAEQGGNVIVLKPLISSPTAGGESRAAGRWCI